MPIRVTDIRLFFRLAWCYTIEENEFPRYLAQIPTPDIIKVFEDEGEIEGIRRLAMEGLLCRTKEKAVFHSFLKLTNKVELDEFEYDVLLALLAIMPEKEGWEFISENVRFHNRREVRLRLVEIMGPRDHYNELADGLMWEILRYEGDPDIRLIVARAIAKRPGHRMNSALIQLLDEFKELAAMARKELLSRDEFDLENQLCEKLQEHNEKGGEKSAKISKNLRSIISRRIQKLDYGDLLKMLVNKVFPEEKLQEQGYTVFKQKLCDSAAYCSDLFELFEKCGKHPREKDMIFRAILQRADSEVIDFLKRVARESDPKEDFWIFAIADLDRRGEGNNFKAEVLCET